MTLNTTYSPAVADGNGVTKQFSYSFNPISINYLKVSLEISGQWVQQLSGWTATVSENGGIVTFDVAPTTRVAIERDVPEEQPTSYETSSGFQAKVIEHSFDMLTGMVQELKEKSDRSVSVEVGSPISPEQVVQQIERVYTSIDNVDAVADDLTNVDTVASDLTNINKVAGSITNVNKVGNSITKVNTVAGSISKVGTVADNISDVNAVGGDIVKVKAVADDLTNVDKVANNQANINKVASIDSDVSAVAGIKNDVSTVSGISGNVTSVAGNSTNVTKVATNISNVNKVGNAISNVNKVGNNIADVNDVADDLANIDIVAGDIADVSAVGGNISNVTAVANDLTNIDAVAGNRTNINTVATNNTNVSRVGSNINNVNSVANNETNINTIASNISDVSNVASYLGNISTVADGMTEVQAVADDLSNIDGVSQYLGQIENVSDNITNVNAVGSNISNVNTVAGDHANIQTVVNNMTAINNAPTYANNSKIWAEGLDGEVAPLGGTHSSKGWAQIAEQAASGVQNPANRDLSNLTNTGQMIIDSQNGTISNCILEIPQNLKLTLENNVLTLKSGSIYVVTSSTYSTYTLTTDATVSVPTTQGRYVILPAGNNIVINPINQVGSGTTLPAVGEGTFLRFFKVDEYKWYNRGTPSGSWGASGVNYPICCVDVDSNGVASFAKDSNGNDMIFNGMGFVGHHAIVYPNVKVLEPIGKNADGTLKSREYTNNSLQIAPSGGTYNRRIFFNGNEFWVTNANLTYNKDENLWYQDSTPKTNGVVYLGDCFTVNDIVTDFTIRQPYEGARNLLTDDLLNGNNTFTGKNKFLQNPVVEGTNQFYEIKDDNLTKGTAPTAIDRDSFIQVADASEQPLAACFYRVDTSGNAYTALVTYKFENNNNNNVQIGVYYNADGTAYATCPTPAISDDSNKIVTTEWFNDKLVLVNELPANPDSNVWYAIPEEE